MSWCKDIWNELDEITTISRLLFELSDCFYEVGNEKLSIKLAKYAAILSKSTKSINKTISNHIDTDYKGQVETSKAMLELALHTTKENK